MADPLAAINEAKLSEPQITLSSWQARDIILYNLAVGAKPTSLSLIYENDTNFQALPTFGVTPYFGTSHFTLCKAIPNYSLPNLLHAEQYLEIRRFPIPRQASVVSYSKLVDVLDKEKAAIVVTKTITKDSDTGEELFYNESTFFARGSGNFGGRKSDSDRERATQLYQPRDRPPDVIACDQTSIGQAALYRLCGDQNPVHIDPVFSQQGGLHTPILHGLCSFGFSGRHIFESFGPVKNIRARFVGIVLPGQTLITEMWKENDSIIFQTRVQETGELCIASGGAELHLVVGARL